MGKEEGQGQKRKGQERKGKKMGNGTTSKR